MHQSLCPGRNKAGYSKALIFNTKALNPLSKSIFRLQLESLDGLNQRYEVNNKKENKHFIPFSLKLTFHSIYSVHCEHAHDMSFCILTNSQ